MAASRTTPSSLSAAKKQATSAAERATQEVEAEDWMEDAG